jgi:hypothetical protein
MNYFIIEYRSLHAGHDLPDIPIILCSKQIFMIVLSVPATAMPTGIVAGLGIAEWMQA